MGESALRNTAACSFSGSCLRLDRGVNVDPRST